MSDPMPPWFAKVMESCEALSLDDARDRVILWERISEAWPHDAIEAAVDALDIDDGWSAKGHERNVAEIKGAMIAALEHS